MNLICKQDSEFLYTHLQNPANKKSKYSPKILRVALSQWKAIKPKNQFFGNLISASLHQLIFHFLLPGILFPNLFLHIFLKILSNIIHSLPISMAHYSHMKSLLDNWSRRVWTRRETSTLHTQKHTVQMPQHAQSWTAYTTDHREGKHTQANTFNMQRPLKKPALVDPHLCYALNLFPQTKLGKKTTSNWNLRIMDVERLVRLKKKKCGREDKKKKEFDWEE